MKKTIIIDELYKIAKENNIHILFASEVGSRSYGFPTTDSDYDVKFVYIRPEKEYLKIKRDHKDTIILEKSFESEKIDFSGWDITKFLKLMYDGNYSVFEWLVSPYKYIKDENFYKLMGDSIKFFIPYRSIHAYYSYALTEWQYIRCNEDISIKKYLHAIDAIVNARGCELTKVPNDLNITKKLYRTNDDVVKIVLQLIEDRANGKTTTVRNPDLDSYISLSLSHLDAILQKWNGKRDSVLKYDTIDDIFYQLVKEKRNEKI